VVRLLLLCLLLPAPAMGADPGASLRLALARAPAPAAGSASAQGPPAPPAAAPARGPFAAGTDTLEVTGAFWLEAWNKNLATDRLAGGRIAHGRDWHRGWQSVVELEVHRAGLGRARDAVLVGISGLARRRFFSTGRNEAFVELGVGAALATLAVPRTGTAFNFLLQGGGGVVRALSPRTSLVAGARLWHLSNGGIVLNQHRNPDIEGLGGYAGLQVHFR
jgi:hypothetical protein